MLFVELALIRWVTSNNVFVTKATNFVLLASFLGIGIGFLNARTRRDYLRWTPVALLLLVGFVLAFPVILSSLSGPHPYRGLRNMLALPQPVSLSVIFVLVTAVMAGLGQGVARIFTRFRPLSAYRLDVAGSIAGIALFSLLSFLNQPPATWGFIACAGIVLILAPRIRWWQVAAALVIITLLCLESFIPNQTWSPYNKLSVQAHGGRAPALYVSANNVPYQAARSLAILKKQKPFYFYPYLHIPRADLKNVLIIGAGTGNDTTVALSEGAQHVDAVEIDPQLLHIGRQQNPSHPFDSSRVTTHTADGREYLQDTNKRYNLILFALPDSLEAVSGQSAIRLESFLLTSQSVATVKKHLVPGGTFAMYNYYAPFLLNRYASTIESAFNRDPCQNVGPPLGGRRLAVLTAHLNGPVPGCASYWHGQKVAPSTDDHPFPYLPSSTIPGSYLWMLGAILLGSILLVRVGGGSYRGDAAVRRPGLHGRRVPLARDEEHRAVRAAFRHHLVRELAGVRRGAGRGVSRGGDGAAYQAATPVGALRPADRVAGRHLAGTGGSPAQPAAGPALPGGQRAGLRPGVPGEPGLRAAVRRRGDNRHGVRRQPARRDRRRYARIPCPHHRLPVPADRGRRALRTGLRDAASAQVGVAAVLTWAGPHPYPRPPMRLESSGSRTDSVNHVCWRSSG